MSISQNAPGTPGYANDALSNFVVDDKGNTDATDNRMFDGSITISEVMFDGGPRWNLVQWIELYNSSMTTAVNLKGWTLEIRNRNDVQSYVDESFEFEDATILPNQTLLLVSDALLRTMLLAIVSITSTSVTGAS